MASRTSTTLPPSRPSFPRGKFLFLPSKPATPPIPPSLLAKVPHLSPYSMLPLASADPRPPSEEAEAWLGDTVPLSFSNRRDGNSGASTPALVIRRPDKGDSGTRWQRGESASRISPFCFLHATTTPGSPADWQLLSATQEYKYVISTRLNPVDVGVSIQSFLFWWNFGYFFYVIGIQGEKDPGCNFTCWGIYCLIFVTINLHHRVQLDPPWIFFIFDHVLPHFLVTAGPRFWLTIVIENFHT